MVVALLAIALPAAAGAQGFKLYYDLVSREPKVAPADHRIYYGSELVHFGDLRLPKGPGPHPVAIVIHGGAWSSSVALHYTSPLSAELTCMGVATWNIEYRRLGGGGGWPTTFQDVSAAADFLRELAKRFPLDLSRVVVTGHSAGGQLGLWLAARHRLPPTATLHTPNPLPIRGVVALAGPGDLARFIQEVPRYTDAVNQLFGGGTPEQIAARMKEGSPVELLPLGVPQVFVNGTKDTSVPLELVEEFVAKAKEAGDTTTLIPVPDGQHFESVDPANPVAGPAIVRSVLGMLGVKAPRGTHEAGACRAARKSR
ncbi:alpha/beta hydrolase [Pyxidicoccus fallax]|uniref:Alpha/beta hydrolase n=2 Tax=Pyxidicoccus fallax TaxID=394095 RepID=A0A848LDJ9_9BACT|nr:alpha/beta hydrolase [Pyxidicoccus fallax]NPC78387.1 alpha/beta hydrolase [Pyxidicoccus fallax]